MRVDLAMPLTTTIPTFNRWRTAPSIETLRSRYDASALQWQDNLIRLGQLDDYQLLFKSEVVSKHLSHLDQTSKMLDCGVGTGAFSLALLDSLEQPIHVSGIDISSHMLTEARRVLGDRCNSLALRREDISHLPYADESFDAVIFAHVLEHMTDPVDTLQEIVRVLKPGAPLIASVTRKGFGQLLMSLRWQNRGYTSRQLVSFFQTVDLEEVASFDYGASWSRWMCLAAIGVKPNVKSLSL